MTNESNNLNLLCVYAEIQAHNERITGGYTYWFSIPDIVRIYWSYVTVSEVCQET